MNENSSGPVLIVEPDRALAASLSAAVQVSGYHVTLATNAEDALKLIYGGSGFCAILIAFALPRLSGADFCALYRSGEDFPCADLIGMSSDHRNQLEMLAAGADAFLTKPFSMAILKSTLQRAHAKNSQ